MILKMLRWGRGQYCLGSTDINQKKKGGVFFKKRRTFSMLSIDLRVLKGKYED